MEINSYTLSRAWFNFSFENPEKVKPNHTALYFFCVEHCNRLGWKKKFGLPTTMAKDAIGIRSYNTYINTFNDLEKFGFIKVIERSKNQYSSNIIALSNFNKALDKALDKALIKHGTKQRESTEQSIDSIIKQLNKEQLNNKQLEELKIIIEKNTKKENIDEIIIQQLGNEFLEIVLLWLKYKKERKQTYKQTGLITFLKTLKKYSKGNLILATEIIEKSISNNYSGIFELKEKPTTQTQSQDGNTFKPKRESSYN